MKRSWRWMAGRLAALALAAVMSAAPAALAGDGHGRSHGHSNRYGHHDPYRGAPRYYDHLGRPVDPRYFRHDEYKNTYRAPPPYQYRSDYGHSNHGAGVVVVGGYFHPDFAYSYHHRHGSAYRVYRDYRGPWSRPYRVGYAVPRGVVCRPLHGSWGALLPPAPYGHHYVQVDRDVLLVAAATNRIVDAIVLLSALD